MISVWRKKDGFYILNTAQSTQWINSRDVCSLFLMGLTAPELEKKII